MSIRMKMLKGFRKYVLGKTEYEHRGLANLDYKWNPKTKKYELDKQYMAPVFKPGQHRWEDNKLKPAKIEDYHPEAARFPKRRKSITPRGTTPSPEVIRRV